MQDAKTELGKLFKKEFLETLEKACSEFTIIDYIMDSKNISFHNAILELSKYCELKPEYILKKK